MWLSKINLGNDLTVTEPVSEIWPIAGRSKYRSRRLVDLIRRDLASCLYKGKRLGKTHRMPDRKMLIRNYRVWKRNGLKHSR